MIHFFLKYPDPKLTLPEKNMKTSILTVLLASVKTLSFGHENNNYRSSLKKLMQISSTEVAYKGALNQMIFLFKQQQSSAP